MAGYHPLALEGGWLSPLTVQIAELLLDKESEGERAARVGAIGILTWVLARTYMQWQSCGAYMPGAGVVGRGATAAGASLYEMG